MPTSNAFAGVGAKFYRGDSSSNETFTAIAEINSISGPNKSRDTIDVTTLDSTGGYREFIGGFRDGGEITLNMNFTRDSWDELNVDFEAATLRNYRIEFPDGTNGALKTDFTFAGLVSGLSMDTPPDDKVTSVVTIKISGAITLSST